MLKRHTLAILLALGTTDSGALTAVTAQQQPTGPAAPAAPPAGYTIADPKFSPLPGARAYYGSRKGYGYQMEVPANWNGELVVWAHGFRGFSNKLTVEPPPTRTALIASGFAWVASSFSANGWAVREGSDDSYDLSLYFASKVGMPARAYLFGASMGGNVVTDSLETYPRAYQGAMPICGALTGTELFDYFLSYTLVAQYLTGQPGGLDLTNDPQGFARAYGGVIAPALGTPGAYTERGRQFDSVIKNLSGGERPFRVEGLLAPYGPGITFYTGLFGVGQQGIANLAPGRQVASNAGLTYVVDPGLGLDAARLNAGVRRLVADPAARGAGRGAGYGVPTGNIRVPVLSLHTTGDAYVPVLMEISYRRKVNAAGKGDLLVQRLVRRPGHCEFSGQELVEGFADLVAWVRGGPKPAGESVLGNLSDAGRPFTKPFLPGDPGSK